MSHKYSGFTLVELMLSMAFLSMMLMAIAMTIIQISSIYARGETLRQVNQASRLVSTDLRRIFSESDTSTIDLSKVESNRRLCTGQFTYIWTGTDGVGDHNTYAGDPSKEVRLVRIVDPGSQYCRSAEEGSPNVNTAIQDDGTTGPVELLETGDRPLRIHKFTIEEAGHGQITNQRLYLLRLLIGTDNTEAIDTTTDTCLVGSGSLNSDINYCAVNEFNLTIRAGMR